jgi:hypothetical protein
MQPPIFFIHPPKSGGSTVISFFDLNKGKDQFINFEWDQHGWADNRAKLSETGVGGGHQSYGIHRILKTPLTYCTILRDPLARQISHYWYAFNGKNGEIVRGASVSAVEALVRRGEISLDEWISESYGGKNLFVHMLSGQSTADENSLKIARENLRKHIRMTGLCENMSEFLIRLCGKTGLRLPFYFETNKTEHSPRSEAPLSEPARRKFIEQNHLDYELVKDVMLDAARDVREAGSTFSKAMEVVNTVQAEIDKLENPYRHTSTIFGFDADYLAKIRSLICKFDLRPIDEYIEFAQTQHVQVSDMHDGFVDAVHDGVVSGWVVNLSKPEKPVLLEVRVGDKVVATGWSGTHRPDVREAGYQTSQPGFSIVLPEQAVAGFRVTIADSQESLHNSGIWRQGWHRV